MTRKEYNGHYNYETWVVKLWMDNDQGSSEYWNERAEFHVSNDNDASDLASEIEDAHKEALPEVQGFAADLLNAAMSEVSWHEIASSLMEDAEEF